MPPFPLPPLPVPPYPLPPRTKDGSVAVAIKNPHQARTRGLDWLSLMGQSGGGGASGNLSPVYLSRFKVEGTRDEG